VKLEARAGIEPAHKGFADPFVSLASSILQMHFDKHIHLEAVPKTFPDITESAMDGDNSQLASAAFIN